jgi:hypothetical protein
VDKNQSYVLCIFSTASFEIRGRLFGWLALATLYHILPHLLGGLFSLPPRGVAHQSVKVHVYREAFKEKVSSEIYCLQVSILEE